MVICSADTILARSVLFVMDNSNVALKNGEDWKGFKTPEKKKHKQIYTDTLLDSGKNILIHIIDEISTVITIKLQRHLHHHDAQR